MTAFPLSLERVGWSDLLSAVAGVFLPEPPLVLVSVLLLC